MLRLRLDNEFCVAIDIAIGVDPTKIVRICGILVWAALLVVVVFQVGRGDRGVVGDNCVCTLRNVETVGVVDARKNEEYFGLVVRNSTGRVEDSWKLPSEVEAVAIAGSE